MGIDYKHNLYRKDGTALPATTRKLMSFNVPLVLTATIDLPVELTPAPGYPMIGGGAAEVIKQRRRSV